MKFLVIPVILASMLFSYTDQDWKVYNGCKAKVYDGKNNNYDYEACREMLNHKSALKKYGAESSYNYWIKRLYK